jgi:hypothetical protein
MLKAMLDLDFDMPLPRCWEPPPDVAARSATAPLPVRRIASFESAKSSVPRLIIAAAREEQSAWDAQMDDGLRHGAFTYHATRALSQNHALTADALINHVSPLISVRFPQHPALLGDAQRFGQAVFQSKENDNGNV